MHAFHTLLPVILLIAIGWGLAKIRFLGTQFMTDLNKLTFYVALPAFIVHSVSQVQVPAAEALRLFLILSVCTVLAAGIGAGASILFGVGHESWSSVAQSSFRGNIAFGGLPILTYSLANTSSEIQAKTLGVALLVFGPLIAFYNLFAVLCLHGKQAFENRNSCIKMAKQIASNPLIISCLIGFLFSLSGVRLPSSLMTTLGNLGDVALPIALLCIGGAFISVDLRGKWLALSISVLVKICILPAMVWVGCAWLGIEGNEKKIAMIFSATPTAATAYTMAKEMGGDAILTSATVAISTILAMLSLTAILWLCP